MESSSKLINDKYKKISLLGQGSGGKVYLVERVCSHPDLKNENANDYNIQVQPSQKGTKAYFALKKLKHYGKNPSNLTHEIALLSILKNPNIIKFEEIFTVDKGYKKNIYILMQHCIQVLDLFKYKEISLSEIQLKQIISQLVNAISYMHENGYLHRDIKPSNILIQRNGVVKLADFDIATQIKPQMTKNMTTRYYRAPEIIFGSNSYSYQVDIWSLGCTICELILQHPIFPGTTDIDQLEKIFQVLGSPSKYWTDAENYPFYLNFQIENEKGLQNILPIQNSDLLDLVKNMLVLDPTKRISIKEVKQHPYLRDVDMNLDELLKICSYVSDRKIKQIVNASH